MDLGGVQLTSEKKAEVMAQVKQQIAIANLQETIQVMFPYNPFWHCDSLLI